ncbi:MAG TPA: prepilin-type N-terminal cleavage/methylation domain-containing protein, partial [Psychrobacter sp.]|uniref:prepilin-type N-terminal cleavage/methylation domain-containing protein n=1 Tax=Psychrobacter sp. TaxID=56811 RepID=UPI002B5A206F
MTISNTTVLILSKNSENQNEHGFTLIELIVTVAILAIIATIATPYILSLLARMEARRIAGQIDTTLT